jgi:hypothetical protein
MNSFFKKVNIEKKKRKETVVGKIFIMPFLVIHNYLYQNQNSFIIFFTFQNPSPVFLWPFTHITISFFRWCIITIIFFSFVYLYIYFDKVLNTGSLAAF